MSTLLVNTDGGNGGSFFKGHENLFSNDTQLGRDLGKFNITLNNDDGKPILKPRRQVIDVVNDFSWYAGPKATEIALNKIPCAFIIEREQLLSSLISGALYYLNAGTKSIQEIGNSNYIKSILGRVSIDSEKVLTDIGAGINDFIGAVQSRAGGTLADRQLLAQNNLKSLQGIYFTKPTGFHYRFPMYEGPSDVGNDWQKGPAGDSLLNGVVDIGSKIVENISQVVNFAQPGTYIEQPKFFQGPKEGKEETITFPLANTIRRGNVSPIQQNYELLWLLAFQNKPYKTSFGRTPPPKIYSVSVPGQFSMPYAYISGMSVDFEGTVRKTKVTVPSGSGEGFIGNKVIETPVPEAYKVKLTFQSLIGDYGNTMLGNDFNVSIDERIVRIGR